MNGKMKLLILVAVLAVLLIAGGVFYGILSDKGPTDQTENTPLSNAAPDFTVLNGVGKAVRLSDLRGKPTVVNFWATWCGYCVMEMPAFETLYKEYGDRVNFMMVDLTDGVQETKEKAEGFIANLGYTFPLYYDTTGMAQQTYAAYSIPLTVLVDEKGNLYQKHVGAMDEATLRNYIENLLGGK